MSNYQTDQRQGAARGTSATWAWIVAVVTFGYMLPWAISASRGSRNSAATFMVNLFLGWTVIGWFVALAMAMKAHAPVPTIVVQAPPPVQPPKSS